MKRFLAIILAAIMLLGGCGAAIDTTEAQETSNTADVTDAKDVQDTTEAPETEEPVKIERNDFAIVVKEDAYVLNMDGNGNQSDKNFGTETLLDTKTTGTNLTRYGYVKFDISELTGNNEFTCIDLDLTVLWRQVDTATKEFATVDIYGCETSWDENSITFNTQPNAYNLICSIDNITAEAVTRSFPVTAYVKAALESVSLTEEEMETWRVRVERELNEVSVD